MCEYLNVYYICLQILLLVTQISNDMFFDFFGTLFKYISIVFSLFATQSSTTRLFGPRFPNDI